MESRDNLSLAGHRDFGTVVHSVEAPGEPLVIVVCEHASRRIPAELGDMGLGQDSLHSHIAWDPGALPVAQEIARQMSGALIFGGVSRLVYDCNRPPDANDAMPAKSEDIVIPANVNLIERERTARIDGVYIPFCAELTKLIERYRDTLELVVTVHSFTPVYRGKHRDVEIGVLHGEDARFALQMMETVAPDLQLIARLNEPYSAADGVAHTLDCHAAPRGLLNVMIEIRNDLIETPRQQQAMADILVPWIVRTLDAMGGKDVAC